MVIGIRIRILNFDHRSLLNWLTSKKTCEHSRFQFVFQFVLQIGKARVELSMTILGLIFSETSCINAQPEKLSADRSISRELDFVERIDNG